MAVNLETIVTATPQQCAAILAAVAARLATVAPEIDTKPADDEPDELIDAKAVAAILKYSVSNVQHRAKQAPLKFALVQSMGRGIRFSRKKIERLIEREAGRDPRTSEIGLRGVNSGRRRRARDASLFASSPRAAST